MKSVRELHDKAMALAHLALVAFLKSDQSHAKNLVHQAYEYEVQAADLVPTGEASEPTRSILYQSAASLAYQCEEFEIAQSLIDIGLSGYPTPQIKQELKDLDKQIKDEIWEHRLKTALKVLEKDQCPVCQRNIDRGDIAWTAKYSNAGPFSEVWIICQRCDSHVFSFRTWARTLNFRDVIDELEDVRI